MKSFILVFCGGGLGSVLRYVLSMAFNQKHIWPGIWGTFLANVVACFVLGVMVVYVPVSKSYSEEIKLLFAVGFCGGLSTFSTYSLEVFNMRNNSHELWLALFYMVISIVLGLAALWSGMRVVYWLQSS